MRPAVDDEDLVGPAHGGQPVGDDERRAPVEGGVEGPLHRGLRLGVEVGRGLVEHDDARSLEQQPGDGQPLLLAAREPVAAVADDRVEPLGEGVDEPETWAAREAARICSSVASGRA